MSEKFISVESLPDLVRASEFFPFLTDGRYRSKIVDWQPHKYLINDIDGQYVEETLQCNQNSIRECPIRIMKSLTLLKNTNLIEEVAHE